jgi:chorismate mutase/prephenate dehydratase
MKQQYLKDIYNEIFSASRDLQQEINVAFFGLKQSYSHLASIKCFGKSAKYVPCPTINDVFLKVEKNNVKFGVVPIENSTEGIVTHTFDLMMEKEVNIYSEIFLDIHHNLISKETDMKNIKKVYSHQQAIAQTRNWLSKKLVDAEIVPVESTTLAAKMAMKEKFSAAIASTSAALEYKLNILEKNIEDKSNNKTKFLVISLDKASKGVQNKTSIMFSVKDKIGALYEMLLPFRKYGLNLTKIESRPTKKKAWEYVFFVDFLGYKDEENVNKALKELEKKCFFLKILGSYPIETI